MKKRLRNVFLVLLVVIGAYFIYAEFFAYQPDERALQALQGSENVIVTETKEAICFDGPGEDIVLVFYPGANVEEASYAPLMEQLAERGIDGYIVKMPCHTAFLGMNNASAYIKKDEKTYYLMGHSMGGAAASVYAAGHEDEFAGLILLAAYPVKSLESDVRLLTIFGDHDGHLDMMDKGVENRPKDHVEALIVGGNHAQFGSYGIQRGDGSATISSQAQTEETVNLILSFVNLP